MALKDKIRSEMLQAQKEGKADLVRTLKFVWSEIGYVLMENKDSKKEDELVLGVLKREAKKRKEAMDIFGKAGDEKRVRDNKFELETIEAYLPKQMGEEEVKEKIAKIAKESGKKGGLLIGEVMKALKGEADGGLVARIVNQEYA